MYLSNVDILKALDEGELTISPFNESLLGPTSIDLRLSKHIAIYEEGIIKINKECPALIHKEIPNSGYTIQPGGFVLGATIEHVQISNGFQAFVETRGNAARAGLQVHNADSHIDPGTNHHITLEIKNQNTIPITIYSGISICQLYIAMLATPTSQPYCECEHGI